MGKQKAPRKIITIYCSIVCCTVRPLYMNVILVTLSSYSYINSRKISTLRKDMTLSIIPEQINLYTLQPADINDQALTLPPYKHRLSIALSYTHIRPLIALVIFLA